MFETHYCFSKSYTNIRLIYCLIDAPVYLSLPHFLFCDEKYLAAVEGLSPDPEIHNTFVEVEPVSVTLQRSHRLLYRANRSESKTQVAFEERKNVCVVVA